MKYSVFLHPKAASALKKLDKPTKERIKDKLYKLKKFPKRGKHLEHSSLWSLRIGDYRAIYELEIKQKKIIVLYIGHRKNVYDDFSKLF